MSFNAQLRSDIETLDVTINNYERMANAQEAWERIKKNVAQNSASTNTGMLSASQIAAFKEAFGALSGAREKLLESDNKFAAVWRQLQHT